MSTSEKLAVPMTPDSLEVALRLVRNRIKKVELRCEHGRRFAATPGEEAVLMANEAELVDLQWLLHDLEEVS